MTKLNNIFILIIITLITSVGILYFLNPTVRSAPFSFLQTTWSGGADIATTTSAQTGWDRYCSKDDTISTSTPGQLSLASSTVTWTETSTADFASGTVSGVYATSSAVSFLKSDGMICGDNSECASRLCKNGNCESCDSFVYGGETYSVVVIGDQCWMAKNLNIGVITTSINTGADHTDVSDNNIIEKYCYSNSEANCNIYGGLYDWNEAMGYSITEGVQGICPAGWHIPSDSEWHTLELFLTDEGQTCSASRVGGQDCYPAGLALLSGGSSGFEALYSGWRYYTGLFNYLGTRAQFWTSTFASVTHVYFWQLTNTDSRTVRNSTYKTFGFSIRCIKD